MIKRVVCLIILAMAICVSGCTTQVIPPTLTSTSVPATFTKPPTATNTPIPSTSTYTPTATVTATNTPLPPTATLTATLDPAPYAGNWYGVDQKDKRNHLDFNISYKDGKPTIRFLGGFWVFLCGGKKTRIGFLKSNAEALIENGQFTFGPLGHGQFEAKDKFILTDILSNSCPGDIKIEVIYPTPTPTP